MSWIGLQSFLLFLNWKKINYILILQRNGKLYTNCTEKWQNVIQDPDKDWREVFAACFKFNQASKYI